MRNGRNHLTIPTRPSSRKKKQSTWIAFPPWQTTFYKAWIEKKKENKWKTKKWHEGKVYEGT